MHRDPTPTPNPNPNPNQVARTETPEPELKETTAVQALPPPLARPAPHPSPATLAPPSPLAPTFVPTLARAPPTMHAARSLYLCLYRRLQNRR